MKTITGFNITKGGKFVEGVFATENMAKERLRLIGREHPGQQFYLQPHNIYIPEESVGIFGFRRFEGQWELSRYAGMGNTDYYSMGDHEALRFAEAVYHKLGKIPGDYIKKEFNSYLESAMEDIRAAQRELEK